MPKRPTPAVGLLMRLAAAPWRFARTMPKNPHTYIVEDWPEARALVRDMRAAIARFGFDQVWKDGRPWRYLTLGDWTYWMDDDVLNRKPHAHPQVP